MQCSLVFDHQPSSYATNKAKILYVMGLLRGKALACSSAVCEIVSFAGFLAEMRKIFDHSVSGRDATKHLLPLHQGSLSVADYSIEFDTITGESGWNEVSLQGAFLNGLCERDELAVRDESEGLGELIALAIKLDNCL